MSKIRSECEGILQSDDPEYEFNTTIQKQANRVLLLEKAYRYQRAGMRLTATAWMLAWNLEKERGIDATNQVNRTTNKAAEYNDKAAELYLQAESI